MGPRGPALFHLISVLVQPVKGQATDFGHGVSIHGLVGENRRFLPPSTAHTNATQSRDYSVFAKAPLFRLGSGARVAPRTVNTKSQEPQEGHNGHNGHSGHSGHNAHVGPRGGPPFGLRGPVVPNRVTCTTYRNIHMYFSYLYPVLYFLPSPAICSGRDQTAATAARDAEAFFHRIVLLIQTVWVRATGIKRLPQPGDPTCSENTLFELT